jgi:ribosomal protein S18 acetylase RimI-like enzyme
MGMNLQIRAVLDEDIEAVVQLSLLAWEPIFISFKQILGAEIYARIYPDWQTLQRTGVEAICKEGGNTLVWVAEVDGIVAGFIACKLNMNDKSGEVEYLAVHPAYQNRGIGTALNTFTLNEMKQRGMRIAVLGTGGDDSHAPARRSYEKAGYTALPLVRYYKDL